MKRVIIIILLFLVVYAQQAGAGTRHIPMITNILVDASGSVSERDFQVANQMIAKFVDELYQRSFRYPGELADWISVAWFGADDQYQGTRFINASSYREMSLLYELLLTQQHPKHGHTAIYKAIVNATNDVIDLDNGLPGRYVKLIIVVTDGEDNDSTQRAKTSVKAFYPNEEFFLVTIGVGNKPDIRAFQGIATELIRINQFDELLEQLIRVLDVIPVLYNLNGVGY